MSSWPISELLLVSCQLLAGHGLAHRPARESETLLVSSWPIRELLLVRYQPLAGHGLAHRPASEALLVAGRVVADRVVVGIISP